MERASWIGLIIGIVALGAGCGDDGESGVDAGDGGFMGDGGAVEDADLDGGDAGDAGEPVSPLRFATFNAGLSAGEVLVEERFPLIAAALAAETADVLCVQEVFETVHWESLLEAPPLGPLRTGL